MYGISEYGLLRYAAETTISDDNIKLNSPDLMKYLPDYYDESASMKAIQNADALEIGRLNYNIKDLRDQFFTNTATWGLIYMEKEFGLKTNLNLSYEERRTLVKAKKSGQGTTTKAMIKTVAENFSGGEVNVIEDNANYKFTIQFVGVEGIPKNLDAFKAMIEDIKPAHLDYDFKYTYTVWNFVANSGMTWNNANSKTWGEMRVYS